MATVLSRELCPLMSKQKEYLEIIQKSGRYLLSLVNEISELGAITSKIENLDLATVDVEMLCQQVIHSLEDGAKTTRTASSFVGGTRSHARLGDG